MEAPESLHPLIRERYSPLIFSGKPVPEDSIQRMFEAARWAPSSFNEQPWRFLYAIQGEKLWDDLFSILTPGNQSWVQTAPGLVLTLSEKKFSLNGKENRHYMHDVGLAVMSFTLQGLSEGIYVHQMAGFDNDRGRELFNIPEDTELVTMCAFGYPGDRKELEGKLKERAESERVRKSMEEIVFRKGF